VSYVIEYAGVADMRYENGVAVGRYHYASMGAALSQLAVMIQVSIDRLVTRPISSAGGTPGGVHVWRTQAEAEDDGHRVRYLASIIPADR